MNGEERMPAESLSIPRNSANKLETPKLIRSASELSHVDMKINELFEDEKKKKEKQAVSLNWGPPAKVK